jgi:hypothetical protein
MEQINRPWAIWRRMGARRKKWTGCGIGAVLLLCCGTAGAIGESMGIIEPKPSRTPSSPPTPTRTRRPAQSPTLTKTPTITHTPTITLTPTGTLRPTKTNIPTDTRWPTATRAPSATSASRSGPIGPTDTSAPAGGSCNWSRDYDCSDFSTERQAQQCFVSCGGSKTNNWSRLDADHDGRACESLP